MYAVIKERSPFMIFTTKIVASEKRIKSILIEKCELLLALDEGFACESESDYTKLKNGDDSVLKGFSFVSTDTKVEVIFYSDNEKEFEDFTSSIRIDDEIGE